MGVMNFIDGNIARMRGFRKSSDNTNYRERLTRDARDSIAIYGLYWLIYAPLALVKWYLDAGSLGELALILLIGLGIILAAMLVRQHWQARPVKRRRIKRKPRRDYRIPPQFDNVFKPDFGRKEVGL